jgi:hypothetical protein
MTKTKYYVYNMEKKDIRIIELGYKRMGENMSKKTISENVKLGYKEKSKAPKNKTVSDNFLTFNGTLLTTEKNPDSALYINSNTLKGIDRQIEKCSEDYNDGSEFEYLYENK